MRGFPRAYPGQRIGLFGGSFDPAHAGHAHVAETARKRLGLDAVWWLVSPQNPLKPRSSPLHSRLDTAEAITPGRHHLVTDIETRLRTQFTVDTVAALQRRYRGVRFVFIMGADGMAGFVRWRDWRRLVGLLPIYIVSRPGVAIAARFAKPFPPTRRRTGDPNLPRTNAPAFAYQPARLHPISSTALRKTAALA